MKSKELSGLIPEDFVQKVVFSKKTLYLVNKLYTTMVEGGLTFF